MSWAIVNEAMTSLLVLGSGYTTLGKSFWDLVPHTKTQMTAASLLGPCELHSKVLRTPPGTEQDQGSLGHWCYQTNIWCAAAEGRHRALSSSYKQNWWATTTCSPFSHTVSLEKEEDGWDAMLWLTSLSTHQNCHQNQYHAHTAFSKSYIATKYRMIKVCLGIGHVAQLVKLLSRHESWVLSWVL